MKIHYLSVKEGTPAKGYWDQTFIQDLLEDLPDGEREVFVIPGAYQASYVKQINEELAKHPKVLVIVTSDEEGNFDVAKLWHPDMIVYSQYGTSPNMFPLGYTPHTRPNLEEIGIVFKDLDFFYSGQINHVRREELARVLKEQDGFNPTPGFSQGMEPKEYMQNMAIAKTVPCPPGNLTQDSFRLYEALEAGAVPIVDRLSAQGNADYWERLFPDAPFPIFSSYKELPSLIKDWQDIEKRNKVFAWWIRKKMEWKNKLRWELECPQEAITVVVPTSPISSHPSTEIIDETIKSIRYHMDSDIILTIDGVREEQEGLRDQYNEYIENLLWKCNFEYKNVIPVLFDKHRHQSGMMKEILPMIKSPLLLYVEHDTPLVTDEPIEWEKLGKDILTGKAHVIRFHFEAFVPEEHKYLMLGEPEDGLQKTIQWSQRPHLARTTFYEEIMKFFSSSSNCFIEDRIYGEVIRAVDEKGPKAWDDWKIWIYHPEGNIKRSLNLDGRGKDQKFDDRQVW